MKCKRQDKCGSCRRYIPNNIRLIQCSEFRTYVHKKCCNIPIREYYANMTWACSPCQAKVLPFAMCPDGTFLEEISSYPTNKSNNLNLEFKPSFTVKTMLNKIPSQAMNLDDLSSCKNSSKYYDIEDFNKLRIKEEASLGFLHINIASLNKHCEELSTLLSLIKYNFHIIAISETRLTDITGITSNINIPNYSFIDVKTQSNAGGVGFYIHNSIYGDIKVRHDLCFRSENDIEAIFIEIEQKKRQNIICGCIYKHPDMHVADFMNSFMLRTLSLLGKESKFTILMGDFNINLLNYDDCRDTGAFYDNMSCSFFQPQILKPSRVTLRSQALIDNIFTNNTKYGSISGNLTCQISDHFLQFSIFSDYRLKKMKDKMVKYG